MHKKDAFIHSSNCGKHKKETTIGHEILIQWKDGSTTWEALKDIKECYPVQLAEFAVQYRLDTLPAFAWWVPHVLKKQQRFIFKVKFNYWVRKTKYGFSIPRTADETKDEDTRNGNTLWMDALRLEMKTTQVTFEEYDGEIKDLVRKKYQEVRYH